MIACLPHAVLYLAFVMPSTAIQENPPSKPAINAAKQSDVDWNELVQAFGSQSGRLERLLEGLTLKPVVLSQSDDDTGEAALGLEYALNKQVTKPVSLGSNRAAGMALNFKSSGTVTFEADSNPNDLLETALDLRFFGRVGSTHGRRLGDLERRAAHDENAKKDYEALQTAATKKLVSITESQEGDTIDLDAALRSQEFQDFLAENPEVNLGPRSYLTWHAGVRGQYETNQEFTERQVAFGIYAGATGFSDHPDTAQWNVLDYPFQLTRWLCGSEKKGIQNKHFPSATVGLDLVDPEDDDARSAVGEDLDPYGRFRAELGFTSDFGKVGDRDLKASLSWRFWQELNASDSVEDADLDRSQLFQVVLTDRESGVFLSYATGNVPLDAESDSVFALGWTFNK